MTSREGSAAPTRASKRLRSETSHDGDRPESSAAAQRRALSLDWYIPHLDQHIAASKRAYLGILSYAYRDDFDGCSTTVEPLRTIWTPDAKSAFFAALSRHSRLRPDLIAHEVGKTEGQVCAYLRLLQDGERQVRRTQGGDPGFRDRRKRWQSGRTWRKGTAPACHLVGEEWVREEEELASQTRGEVQRVEEGMRAKTEAEKGGERARLAKGEKGTKRVMDRKPAVDLTEDLEAQLQREERQAAWGSSLTTAKLDTLQRLLNTSALASGTDDKRQNTPSASSPLKARGHFGKFERIRLDDKAIYHLESIPTADRSKDHHTALRVLLNRRRMRQMKRTKKLLERGMTERQIADQGGVDAIFLREAGIEQLEDDFDVELEFGEKWWAVQAGLCPPLGDSKQNDSEPNPVGGEASLGEGWAGGKKEELDGTDDGDDQLGIAKLGKERGWDLFDFASLNNLIQSFELTTALSFDILDALYHELRAFLVPLILQTITFAEQSHLQRAPLVPTVPEESVGDGSTAPNDGGGPGIERWHVETALSLRGDPSIAPDDPERTSQAQQRRRSLLSAPGLVPWHMLHIAAPPASTANRDETDGMDGTDGTDGWSEVQSTLTDEEDEELDEALEKFDAVHDHLAEGRLWRGEGDDVTVHRPAKRPKHLRKVGTASWAEALQAQGEYEKLLLTIMARRRWRRAVKVRTERARRKAPTGPPGAASSVRSFRPSARKAYTMPAVIVDSDDETVDLGSSDGEEGEAAEDDEGTGSGGEQPDGLYDGGYESEEIDS